MNLYLQRLTSSRAFSVAMLFVAFAPGAYGLAFAQGLSATRGDMADTSRVVNVVPPPSFDQLSPGGRMIAKSLVWAQGDSDFGAAPGSRPESRGVRWSLEKISAARIAGQDWGEVFRQMKAEGLITARTLGEIVNSYYRPMSVSTPVPVSSEPAMSPGGALNAPVIIRTDSPTGASPREREKATP
jgi:hypothetical protein